MTYIRSNRWLAALVILLLVLLACRLLPTPTKPARDTIPAPIVPPQDDPPVPIIPPPDDPDAVVYGAVLVEGGASVVGGYVGDTVRVLVTYAATSRVAPVTEMRTGTSCSQDALADAEWEPFVTRQSFPVRVPLSWSAFAISVQYRDAEGNMSAVYCDDINVEGMVRQPDSAP